MVFVLRRQITLHDGKRFRPEQTNSYIVSQVLTVFDYMLTNHGKGRKRAIGVYDSSDNEKQLHLQVYFTEIRNYDDFEILT